MGKSSTVINAFWCPKCGNKAMDLPRKEGRQHERFHRKKLYCFRCGETLNCIETKCPEDVLEFKEMFERGDFVSEVEESLNLDCVPSGLMR